MLTVVSTFSRFKMPSNFSHQIKVQSTGRAAATNPSSRYVTVRKTVRAERAKRPTSGHQTWRGDSFAARRTSRDSNFASLYDEAQRTLRADEAIATPCECSRALGKDRNDGVFPANHVMRSQGSIGWQGLVASAVVRRKAQRSFQVRSFEVLSTVPPCYGRVRFSRRASPFALPRPGLRAISPGCSSVDAALRISAETKNKQKSIERAIKKTVIVFKWFCFTSVFFFLCVFFKARLRVS